MDLTNLETLKELLARHNVRPNSRASQNFLICPQTLEAIVAQLSSGPVPVTEIGAGPGVLTQALVAVGHRVRAIEKDPAMSTILVDEVTAQHADRVSIVTEDARSASWTWDEPYQLVGNIPYHLTGALVRQLVQTEVAPVRAILLVQHEVAERLTADIPHMSLLTLAVHLWGSATRLATVPPHCFWPQPKVSSALVELTPQENRPSVPAREHVMQVARPFFQARRKQFGGVLKRTHKLSDDTVASIVTALDISPTIRPHEIASDQWKQLAELLKDVTNET